MKTPDIKLKPHPTQRYELIATASAPGPFDSVKGHAFFEVSNVDCVPQGPLTGGRSLPNIGHNFELTRMADGTYRGYFYRDQVQDEDYFGLGICHWDLVSVGPDFEVHSQSFNPALVLDDIFKHNSETRYFKKETFSNRSLTNSNAGSADSWPASSEELKKDTNAFFPITVTVKEAMP